MSIELIKIPGLTSQYVLNMADLALARGAEPEKNSARADAQPFLRPITEDIVTLALLMRHLIF